MTRSDINGILNHTGRHVALSRAYECYMLVMIGASIVPLMFLKTRPVFTIIDYVTVIAFIIDYIARWVTADLSLKRGWRSFIDYPFTPMAIIDLLSILPGLKVLAPSFKLFRLTRMFRIFRVMRVLRYSSKVMLFLSILKKEKTILLSVLVLALFYIFITAIVMFNVEPSVNPITGKNTFNSFFDALYWATVTLTTVGYGDICPVTTAGRFISMLSALFGVAIIALPSGVITASYLDELKKPKNRDDRDND